MGSSPVLKESRLWPPLKINWTGYLFLSKTPRHITFVSISIWNLTLNRLLSWNGRIQHMTLLLCQFTLMNEHLNWCVSPTKIIQLLRLFCLSSPSTLLFSAQISVLILILVARHSPSQSMPLPSSRFIKPRLNSMLWSKINLSPSRSFNSLCSFLSPHGVDWNRDVPYSPSFILDLPIQVEESIRNVIDFVFLPGFNNPTLAILFQTQQTWTGYVAKWNPLFTSWN